MKRKTEMKNFLLNHKGNKYKANNIISLLWNFATGKTSKQMSKGLIILGAFFILSWCWIAYEIWTAPLMPDDFDLKEEDIWPLDERPCNEEEE